MTVLERRHPARWRRRESREVELGGDAVVRHEIVAPDTEDKRHKVAAILEHSGALELEPPQETENTPKQEE
jgi:hypothetical protein